MKKIALIAGSGNLPLEFVRAVKASGDKIVVFALKGMADKGLEEIADKVYWMEIGQYAKFGVFLVFERIKKLVLLGKVEKNVIYNDSEKHDPAYTKGLNSLENKKDYSILGIITKHLAKIGIEVVDPLRYLSYLIPEKGILSHIEPEAQIKSDIEFGYETAKKISAMDVGQTVVVKEGSVVAVEAMEGTDKTIERAKSIAGDGCVMIKVSRPHQDLRWDVPTIGPATMAKLIEDGFRAVAIESGKMYLVDKEKVIQMADDNGIVLQVL